MVRNDLLEGFIDAAFAAFDHYAGDEHARRSLKQIFANLEMPEPTRPDIAGRLPVCDRHLESALAIKTGQPTLDDLIERFKALEPLLEWKPRTNNDGSASENFAESHANTMIIGPGGFEDRRDLWFGAT
ncbi:MAG TPA: dimethylsulfonioproprionate lyase family protein, partial [Pararhizobium sp.]|uniref:dimethylsulfonioproprionate lyase family protein n=1 Tax=Pararhizobium sp. TaxID=1977563 RepID=UPI002C6D76A1